MNGNSQSVKTNFFEKKFQNFLFRKNPEKFFFVCVFFNTSFDKNFHLKFQENIIFITFLNYIMTIIKTSWS